MLTTIAHATTITDLMTDLVATEVVVVVATTTAIVVASAMIAATIMAT